MTYAVILGEALIDLLSTADGALTPVVGGAPFNVAVGLARLGTPAHLLTAVGGDTFGDRIVDYAAAAGVGVGGIVRVPAPTPLAVATYTGSEASFAFYGDPPAYGMLAPTDLDPDLLAGASVLYCGSIALLGAASLRAARHAWATPGPLRAFDPNVRPFLLPDAHAAARLRAIVEEFSAGADLVKLSLADATALYGPVPPSRVALRLLALGAGTVVVTLGAAGAMIFRHRDDAAPRPERMAVDYIHSRAESVFGLPVHPGQVIDTTGAGDSVVAALMHRMLAGLPDSGSWIEAVEFALRVSAHVCARRGGAVAMPTLVELAAS
ncbi:fructokinase [Allocatelliglobosispora scoriae]|uniref:Fructokinase n=1 Tax=Allocatelliglobosispora scoriae TaxID=643052 RepID=A0A841BZU3_9ACTN|nr:PfkB family carbohydrate kinase [Allocatelliglobosispora scoriae]MBB5873116.1 fructokinase [Allocatelliglobosispora scoriae]